MKWDIRPGKEITDYLNGCAGFKSAGTPVPDEPVKNCLDAFNEWNERKKKMWGENMAVDEAYEMSAEFAPRPKTQGEIQELLDAIPEEAVDCAGLFVSYCVNEVYPYDEIELRVDRPLDYLGARNMGKKWKLAGDVGEGSGYGMKRGEIIIEGNAGSYTGTCMKGGKIVVNGNAGVAVGHWMSGGEIRLNGESYGSITDVEVGNIYHKGRRVYEGHGRAAVK